MLLDLLANSADFWSLGLLGEANEPMGDWFFENFSELLTCYGGGYYVLAEALSS